MLPEEELDLIETWLEENSVVCLYWVMWYSISHIQLAEEEIWPISSMSRSNFQRLPEQMALTVCPTF